MRILIAALLIFAVCTPVASARTWTDSTGKFTVEAEFVDFKDGKVQLKKEDGKIVTIPVEKLSEADQAFAKSVKEHAAGDTRIASALTSITEEKLIEGLRVFKGNELNLVKTESPMVTEEDVKALMKSQEIAKNTLEKDKSGRSVLAAANAVAAKYPKCGDILLHFVI